jgi:hypothetical protein
MTKIMCNRERVVFCLIFFLDPGGSREIGLCLHSRIYPLTPISSYLHHGIESWRENTPLQEFVLTLGSVGDIVVPVML